MVAAGHRRRGVRRRLVGDARDGASDWLHVDFPDEPAACHLDARSFRPTRAGLLAL
jgi:hypothetical protein